MDRTKKYTIIFVVICFLSIGTVGIYQLFNPVKNDGSTTEIVDNEELTTKTDDEDASQEPSENTEEKTPSESTTNQKNETTKSTEKNGPKQESTQTKDTTTQPGQKEETVEKKKTICVQIKVKGIDETILNSSVETEQGKTVFDILKKVTSEKGIELKSSGPSKIVYINGIGGLNEFDHGPRSGWTYKVNGSYPSKSAGSYILENGDQIEWIYTKNG